jgi:hypothetical protein
LKGLFFGPLENQPVGRVPGNKVGKLIRWSVQLYSDHQTRQDEIPKSNQGILDLWYPVYPVYPVYFVYNSSTESRYAQE